jgi:hypothetical protein
MTEQYKIKTEFKENYISSYKPGNKMELNTDGGNSRDRKAQGFKVFRKNL